MIRYTEEAVLPRLTDAIEEVRREDAEGRAKGKQGPRPSRPQALARRHRSGRSRAGRQLIWKPWEGFHAFPRWYAASKAGRLPTRLIGNEAVAAATNGQQVARALGIDL